MSSISITTLNFSQLSVQARNQQIIQLFFCEAAQEGAEENKGVFWGMGIFAAGFVYLIDNLLHH
jgi:hypothetical protein